MQVRISETYDLSTQVGKMGLVAIHTPDMSAITRRWGGLLQNHKFVKLNSCDVTLACASMLPADPLQVGTEAGDIAPQDMFNPILYTAVSNDSFNNIIDRIMVLTNRQSDVVNQGSMIDSNSAPTFGDWGADSAGHEVDQFSLYYALLSQNGQWKKSMPQTGLSMKGLYPIVYSLVNTIGNKRVLTGAQSVAADAENQYQGEFNTIYSASIVDDPSSDFGSLENYGVTLGTTLRGPSMRMPAIPTFEFSTAGMVVEPSQTGTPNSLKTWAIHGEIPKCYVAAIIMPPAKLNKLYYRMRVTWTVEFIAPRPTDDLLTWGSLAEVGAKSYGTDYVQQSSTMSAKTSSVDAQNANVELIMEGS